MGQPVIPDTTVFDLVGDISLWKDESTGKPAAGGAFNYTGYNNYNVAGVGSGAVLQSNNDVGIDALSKDALFALSPVSEGGGTIGIRGTAKPSRPTRKPIWRAFASPSAKKT